MAAHNEALRKRLARETDIDISVTGRKSGRTITLPVWFVWEAAAGETAKLILLPAYGSDTQWYKNVLKHPIITVKAGEDTAQFTVAPLTEPGQVSAVVEKFRSKYGAGNVTTYYRKFDVAVIAEVIM
jgi:hypothetical protein